MFSRHRCGSFSWKRKLAIAALGLGAVLGFGSGFRHMRCHHEARRAAFEDHIADVCVRAAARADSPENVSADPEVNTERRAHPQGHHRRHR